MVAISVFSMIMIVCMSSILSVIDANRQAKNLQNVMDNMNFVLDGMTRNIRFGSNYHCGSSGNTSVPADCALGGSSIAIRSSSGDLIIYSLSDGRIVRSVDGSESFITPDYVKIEYLKFWVFGSAPYSNGSNLLQPRVVLSMYGYSNSGSNPNNTARFSIETTISQRILDIQ